MKRTSKYSIPINWHLVLFVLGFFYAFSGLSQKQKVGVVLSGGGATAAAHIGFLKALEEHNIPIDYVTGSSMGAIIGAFYSAGYSVEEIEAIVLSKEFMVMSSGEVPDTLSFYLREPDEDASIINVKFNPKSIIASTLPTHLVDPVLMDYSFIKLFGPASAAANYDFDSLYVPFRAIASDIELNESVVFRKGELNLAARSSGTFPFYMEPLEIDGKLLFDGGLYNNYPADVLYDEFIPDVIIGCNVSKNQSAPTVDNLMSQLINMIQYQTNFNNVCDHMITIEPETTVKTFDFENVGEAISAGYKSTITQMDSILQFVDERLTMSERILSRSKFKDKQSEILIKDVIVAGLPESRRAVIERLLLKSAPYITLKEFEKRFFRLYADDKVRYAYPTLKIDPTDGKYFVTVHVRPEKRMEAGFGGNFSSRPINMGFIKLKYRIPSRNSITLSANSYFGKFYSSSKLGLQFDLNFNTPLLVEANYTFNSWDYYNSFATFLEEVKPSFIIKNEQFGDVNLTVPVQNRGKFSIVGKHAKLSDDYYQTTNFSNSDTTDQTNFKAYILGGEYKRSTLNRKQFADRGTFLNVKYRYINGDEESVPGSTSEVRDTTFAKHSWHILKAQYTNYFFRKKRMTAGFNLESAISDQPEFNNYRATLIRSFAFEPIPESKSFFIDQYRSSFYSSAGLMFNYNLANNLQVRAESHVYRPWERVFDTPDDQGDFNPSTELFFIGSGSLIYQSPLGPLRLSINYYDRKNVPWSVMFNFGYFIFNKGALD